MWESRHHRKGLIRQESARVETLSKLILRCLWMPWKLNWWIGMVFALGSLLFAVASILTLDPTLAASVSLEPASINAIFFAGAIPFNVAAYRSYFKPRTLRHFRREEKGAEKSLSLTWCEEDLLIWVPNIFGSVLFLASGHLAFVEVFHAYPGCQPRSLSWWIVFINLLGCLGFMILALFSIFLPGPLDETMVTIAITFTLQGAACFLIGFLIGFLLMLPETALECE